MSQAPSVLARCPWVTDDARVWRMPDGDEAGVVVQLALALSESQAISRSLAEQLGAANATIATLAVTSHKRLHPDPITVRELYERFKRAYEGHKSWVAMRNRLLPFVEFFGDRLADSITPRDWAAFREKRLLDPVRGNAKSGRKMSKLTINHELGWVKRLFNWGMDEEQALVVCNPFARINRIKCRKARETWITEADAQRMIAAPRPTKHHARLVVHAFLLLMIDTGLRFNEARNLRRDRIRVREIESGRYVVDVGRTKNGKTHMSGLTQRAFDALAEIDPVNNCPYFFARLRRPHGSLIETAELYSERQMRRWFREMCESSGVDAKVADGDVRLRPHDIRHSAATLAHRRGASLKAISRMLNHSDVSITARYIHDEENEAIAIADIMEDGLRIESKGRGGRRRAPHRAAPPHMSDARSTPSRTNL